MIQAPQRGRRLQHHQVPHQICPEEIKITDVVNEFYDPLRRLFKIFGQIT